jgi:hypothetical protein
MKGAREQNGKPIQEREDEQSCSSGLARIEKGGQG